MKTLEARPITTSRRKQRPQKRARSARNAGDLNALSLVTKFSGCQETEKKRMYDTNPAEITTGLLHKRTEKA